MKHRVYYGIIVGIAIVVGLGVHMKGNASMNKEQFTALQQRIVQTPDDLQGCFPTTTTECMMYARYAIDNARAALDAVLAIAPDERTFANTVQAYDTLTAYFSRIHSALEFLTMISPDEAIRDTAQQASLMMQAFAVDAFLDPMLYQAFVDCRQNCAVDTLTDEENYYLDQSIIEFKRDGLNLPEAELAQVKKLSKELNQYVSDFEKNINIDASFILATQQELAGVDAAIVAGLVRDDAGKYVVTCDYPTYTEVMQNCTVSATRQALFRAFQNRAYPANADLLEKIRHKRQALAELLGHTSFAALDISRGMAHSEKTVEFFLAQLLDKAIKKARVEYAQLKDNLLDDCVLDDTGKLYPWDTGYLWNQFKKSHYRVDEREIAEYFPVDKALQGMLQIYEHFLGLTFTVVQAPWVWDNEVILLQVREKTGELCGHLYLDLYPRHKKYSHACCGGIVPRQQRKNDDGTSTAIPGVAVVIANFPKATAEMPALFKHSDVETFFHEFGHAMHHMLGKTALAGNSGTSVKRDFVEMPSQMFEQWMLDKDVLASISGHYKTGQPLPAELIDRKIVLAKADSGRFVARQCMLSMLSLRAHQKDYLHKTMTELDQECFAQSCSDVVYGDGTHYYASFGHLGGYKASYYSYMWSKVFAIDMFYTIKDRGLTDAAVGADFARKVLGRGGSCDPNDIIEDFLGRKPNQEAFLHDLGIE